MPISNVSGLSHATWHLVLLTTDIRANSRFESALLQGTINTLQITNFIDKERAVEILHRKI